MSAEVKLEPFLKCSVIESAFPKYPHRPFRVAFEVLSLTKIYILRVAVYVEESSVLGENLCKVQIDTMHSKKALIRLPYVPENERSRTLWVSREQIEWH